MLRFSAKVLDDKLRQHGALGGVAWRELPWVLNLNGLPLHAAVLLQGGNHRCQRLLRSFLFQPTPCNKDPHPELSAQIEASAASQQRGVEGLNVGVASNSCV